jgi:hypothetical protein
MKKYPGTILLILLVILAAGSCTERIDIDLDDSYTRLVVDGSITTDTIAHTIILTKSTSYFYNQPAPYITGADIKISDGKTIFDLKEVTPGVYQTSPDVYGIEGVTYTLNIRLASPVGGYSDYTASSTLNHSNPLDSIDLVYHPDWSDSGLWEVRCYMLDPPSTDFYRFIISKNDKVLTDTLDEWFVTDDRFINGMYTYGATVAYLDQASEEEKLTNGDKITVEMNSIGKEYARFIGDSQSEIWGSNPLFSGPSANVKGNISNGAIGFFAAFSVSRSYTFAVEPIGKQDDCQMNSISSSSFMSISFPSLHLMVLAENFFRRV